MFKLAVKEKLSQDSLLLGKKAAHLKAVFLNLLKLLTKKAKRLFCVVIETAKVWVAWQQRTTEPVQEGGAKFWVGTWEEFWLIVYVCTKLNIV